MSSTPHAPRLNEHRPPDIAVPPPGVWPPDPQTLPTATAQGFYAYTPNVEAQYCDHEHSLDEDTEVDAAPCPRHPGKKRRPIFGVHKHGNTMRSHQVNDPFNYEHKYPEDPPCQEMGPYARLWKAFLEESAKVDADKVADWTDVLDVLLVFAGLFSAVVSSFVTQTYQKLEVDPKDVAVSLLYELCDLVRALNDKQSADTIPRFKGSPASIFHASRTATWVNGLWFVSLTISLTTALVAVVTKQWIHQYVASVNLGTPRERCRIRQFRYMNLQTWHVPLIIGLLPVLMHAALGIFFAGLVTLALSLHTGIAIATSCIVGLALATYTVANILPVYNAACPYKTPLTRYSFPLLRNQNLTSKLHPLWKFLGLSASPQALSLEITQPSSLDEAEKQLVAQHIQEIDVNATAWLYGSSSNTSLQILVLQALSNIPLQSVRAIKDALAAHDVEAALHSALQSLEDSKYGQRFAYERLVKALLRLYPQQFISWNPPAFRQDHSFIPILLNICAPGPSLACQLLQKEIVSPSAEFDIVVWAQLLCNALRDGVDWLDIEKADSLVWNCFINLLIEPYSALAGMNRRDPVDNLYELPLTTARMSGLHAYGGLSLKLMDTRDSAQSTTPMRLDEAITKFMCPSLSALMYYVTYHKYDTGASDLLAHRRAISGSEPLAPVVDVSSNTRLRLALIQSPHSQHTSFSSEDPSYADDSTVGHAISCIRESVGLDNIYFAHIHHNTDVFQATFFAVKNVISSDAFEVTGSLSLRDRARLLQAFFRTIVLEPELRGPYHAWMSEAIAARVIHAAFHDDSCIATNPSLPADILEAVVLMKCRILLPKFCAELCRREWLDVAASVRLHRDGHYSSSRQGELFYHFLAASFVKGLGVLRKVSTADYLLLEPYVQNPSNVLALAKLLLLSDNERRKELYQLPSFLSTDSWTSCLSCLRLFLHSGNLKEVYEEQSLRGKHPYREDVKLTYDAFEDLDTALLQAARNMNCGAPQSNHDGRNTRRTTVGCLPSISLYHMYTK